MTPTPNKPKKEPSKSSKPNKPIKESKEAYFLRIAEPRVKNVLKGLRILGNCSNRNNYSYTSEQVIEIFESITESLENTISKFTPSKEQQESFSFK